MAASLGRRREHLVIWQWQLCDYADAMHMHECKVSSTDVPAPVSWTQRRSAFWLPHGVIHLDAASRGPRLRAVQHAAHEAIDEDATPWRLSTSTWYARIEVLRQLAADTVFNGDVEGLAMLPSAAHGLETAARNLPLAQGDAVLVLDRQFPSNLLPWQRRCAEAGAELIAVETETTRDIAAAVIDTIERTPTSRVLALPNVIWRDGRFVDLDRIAHAIIDRDIALVLDLSQSLGVMPLDLTRWRPAFVISVGHKWLLGPQGLAWLWASPYWRECGAPLEQHWQARDAGNDWSFPSTAAPPYRSGARRFDAGGITDTPRLAMATAAFRQLALWQPSRIASELQRLTEAFEQALDEHDLAAWRTPHHGPHLSALRVPEARIDKVAQTLTEQDVVLTRRHGLLRIAPYLAVNEDDLRRVVEIAATA